MINSLNSLDHSISYKINQLETSFAEIQCREQNYQDLVQNNVQPPMYFPSIQLLYMQPQSRNKH